ncbi:MAG: VOC family protein [Alphaproteobacteria bacterium]|nr:VOC family protein [Alphaproteobacteria bacterium]
MSARPHISLVTLGVRDLGKAIAFYEGLGLEKAGFDNDDVAFFDMGGLALGLFVWDELAKDAKQSPEASGFRGLSLAWNRNSEEEVDAVFARAEELGATVTKAPEHVFWGGYSGYFTDLDGHLWEIAYNPTWPLRANGAMELPPPVKKPASGKGASS